jgi:DNA-binding winged helix-turn-helix (wHTH) protein
MEGQGTRHVANVARRAARSRPLNLLLVGSEGVFTEASMKRITHGDRFQVVARSSGLLEAISCLSSGAIDLVLLSREFRDEELTLFSFDARRRGFAGLIWHTDNMREKATEVEPQELDRIQVGDFLIEEYTRRVWIRGIETKCSPMELDLLMFLCKHPEELLSHKTLLELLWDDPGASTHSLRVLIRTVRAKIETTTPPRYIVTQRPFGYRFNPSPPPFVEATLRFHTHDVDPDGHHG